MKKITVILMIMTMTSMMSCGHSKKSDVGVADKAVTEEAAPVAPRKSKVVVVARAIVKDGQEVAFADVAKVLVEATRKEPGCIFYNLYQSPQDPKSFIFYEEYKDDAAFASHGSSEHFKAFAGAIPDMLAEELIVEQF
jgi:quinol monooxygenase YgiN